jgi:hypothetical protein
MKQYSVRFDLYNGRHLLFIVESYGQDDLEETIRLLKNTQQMREIGDDNPVISFREMVEIEGLGMRVYQVDDFEDDEEDEEDEWDGDDWDDPSPSIMHGY